jgi:hypothetical protein
LPAVSEPRRLLRSSNVTANDAQRSSSCSSDFTRETQIIIVSFWLVDAVDASPVLGSTCRVEN